MKQISICPNCYDRFENSDFSKADTCETFDEGQFIRCPSCGIWEYSEFWEVEEE